MLIASCAFAPTTKAIVPLTLARQDFCFSNVSSLPLRRLLRGGERSLAGFCDFIERIQPLAVRSRILVSRARSYERTSVGETR